MNAHTAYPIKRLLILAILLTAVTMPLIGSGSAVAQASSAVEQASTPSPQRLLSVGREIQVDDADNGGSIDIDTGDVLAVNLRANLTTGYRWEVGQVDENLLAPVAGFAFQASSERLGAPGIQTLRFDPVADGNAALQLVYRRPWESVPPLRSFTIEIHIEDTGLRPPKRRLQPTPEPVPLQTEPAPNASNQAPTTLPAHFNWCEQGKCTPVRDQGDCGSCWAFGTVGPLESNILIHGGGATDLSEQYLVSCNTDGWSCDGGWYAHDYFLWKAPPGEPEPGAVYEADMPYTAGDSPCGPPHTHHERITLWDYVGGQGTIPSPAAIKQAINDYGPLTVSVCAGPAMENYGGGVFATSESCPYGTNHGVVLVGWDDDDQIWYMKNSWGPGWGENGYMRIRWGTSAIGYGAAYVAYGAHANGDPFEPDNTAQEAKPIENGVPQTHSIIPAGDVDWVKFTLGVESEVLLETSGAAGDTEMWLYDANLNEIEYDDDDGSSWFSLIDRRCGTDPLPAGTYYVKIEAYYDNDQIADYSLSYSLIGHCGGASAWEMRAPMSLARSRLAVAAVNGKVYAIGGESETSGLSALSQGKPAAQWEAAAPQDYSGRVEEYDPSSNAWVTKASLPVPVSNIAAGVITGKIYVPGGYRGDNDTTIADLQIYDPAANTWTSGAAMPAPRSGVAVAVLDGQLYAIGGYTDPTFHNTVYRYDPATDTWTTLASLNAARAWAGAGAVGGKVYVIGGLSDSGDLSSVEEYDPVTDQWTLRAAMRAARGGPGAAIADGYLYAVGGGWIDYLSTVERYSPATDTWEFVNPMNVGRRTLGLVELDGYLWAIGGYNDAFLATSERYGVSQFPPDIDVTPPSLSVTLSPGQAANRTLTIRNTGQGALNFQIAEQNATAASAGKLLLRSKAEMEASAAQVAPDGLHASDRPGVMPFARSMLRRLAGTTAMLAWLRYADEDEEYANTLAAIRSIYTDFTLTETDTLDPSALTAALVGKQVLLLPEPEEATSAELQAAGTALHTPLQNFVAGGGIIVALSEWDYYQGFLRSAGLLDAQYGASWYSETLTVVDRSHPVASGLGTTVAAADATSSYVISTSDARNIVTAPNGQPVVVVRDIGSGHVVLIGYDYYQYNDDAARIIANAVSWSNTDAGIPWLSENPTSGSVPAGGDLSAEISFDTTGLAAGTYQANLVIASNDPDEPEITVPVTLHVQVAGGRLYLAPPSTSAYVGGLFTLDVMLDTGAQPVNNVELYLTFDPALLQVVDASGIPTAAIEADLGALGVELFNSADNSTGQIRYDAGQLSGTPPSGTFRVAVIRFKALAQSSGTPVQYVAPTAVFYSGASVLESTEGANVRIEPWQLVGHVTLQSHATAAGHPVRGWLYLPGNAVASQTFSTTLDATGDFTIENLPGGIHDVRVKGKHSLSTKRAGVTIPTGGAPTDFCTLLEGDANDDDQVSGVDFSILATTYNRASGDAGFDARADFNDDDRVSGVDFSLLATNYSRSGPVACTSIARLDPQQPALSAGAGPEPQSLGTVGLSIKSSTDTPPAGDVITFDLMIEAGAQPVNNVELHVDFDPTALQVVDAAGNPASSIEADLVTLNTPLYNSVDNARGRIRYDAGKLSGTPPTGTFRAASVSFMVVAPLKSPAVRFASPSNAFFDGSPLVDALDSQ